MSDYFQLMLDFDFYASISGMTVPEIFERIDVKIIAELDEDSRFELKGNRTRPRDIGDYCSAFSNTRDGGILVVGVSDTKELEGLMNLDATKRRDLETAPLEYTPDSLVYSKRINYTSPRGEKDYILVYCIYPANDRVVETSSGHAFTRIGHSKRRIKDEELQERKAACGQFSRELEVSRLRFESDFDSTELECLQRKYIDDKNLNPEYTNVESTLRKLHLGKEVNGEFVPTIAASLLLGSDPRIDIPGSRLRFLRFDGEHENSGDRWNPIKDVTIDGTIPELIEKADELIEGQLRDFTALGPDKKFYTESEYPKDAWYEAIVNAFAHRSYEFKNAVTFVKMFDNRLVIMSPGGFPSSVTPLNIFQTQYSRNPFLMDGLRYFERVKCANEGAKRMRDAMERARLPSPEFREVDETCAYVRVTLYNDANNRKPWLKSDPLITLQNTVFSALLPEERKLMLFLSTNHEINISQASRQLDCAWAFAKKLLERLREKGFVERIGMRGKERETKSF